MHKNTITIKHLHRDLNSSIASLKRDKTPIYTSRQIVDQALKNGKTYYGINTGFGALANSRIAARELKTLQKNLIISHAVGLGDNMPKNITRLMMLLKVHSLGLGFSGISEKVFDRLLYFAENNLIPVVPVKGSVGASGDLVPLAHMSLPLLGMGFFWDEEGSSKLAVDTVLKQKKLHPVELQPKDGLALINGTQQMCAYGAHVISHCQHLVDTADLLAAMSLDALKGSIAPFDERIQQLRPHPGQALVAQNIREFLKNSEILESHRNCDKVQDPYSLRCVPQVHGASRDALMHTTEVVEREINSITDNPIIFPEGDIVSGGNFHGQPLALAFDYAAMALSEFASISERRTYYLLSGHDGLPPLLMQNTGVNSGYMIPHYSAAALVSENKVLSHPASVDSIPTSLGQEDHVSMGSISAIKLLKVLENTVQVLAIELFTVCAALDFRKPLKPGESVSCAHEYIRDRITHRDSDYCMQEDLQICRDLVFEGSLIEAVRTKLGTTKLGTVPIY